MSDDLMKRIDTIFARIEGGSAVDMYQLIDQAIDEGEITQEEYLKNEMAIANYFDTHYFTCSGCGWTMPISDMGEDSEVGDLVCTDCEEED